MTINEEAIKSRYEKAGQGHVLKHLVNLSDSEKDSFLAQLAAIKVEEVSELLQKALASQKDVASSNEITPFSGNVGISSDKTLVESSRAVGMSAIAKGVVAALVLAGGQGTRLGFSGPKGMYDIGLPSGKTLFQLISERIKKLCALSSGGDGNNDASLPFYIMTSPINHAETISFFESNSYFGLPKEDVCFFEQGMLPCLTEDGKIILESANKVAMAPDGNGGIYPSLQETGMLDDMAKRGVQYIHVFSIDNALTRPADPVFVGYCISNGADCGNKVVWKAHAHEKVGVIAEKSGKPCIVEYSDISKEMAEQTDDDDDKNGRLRFGAGNICNHFYTLDFLRNVVLPNMQNMYHVARKKIPCYNEETKETITPNSNNGIKLESFIFDVFPLSKNMAVLDVLREDEFAPVKNAPGSLSDSPDTARVYISSQSQKWVVASGGKLTGDTTAICEVVPATSYAGEGLEDLVKDKEINCPFKL